MKVGQTRYMRFGPQRERTDDLKVSVGWGFMEEGDFEKIRLD